MENDVYTPWTRPEGWPDLDSLNLDLSGTTSFAYMTFRTGHIDDVCALRATLVSGTTATIELGTITNGTFTATISESLASNTDKVYWFTPANGYSEGTIVVKVTGRFTKFYLKDITRASSDGGGTLKYYMQPMLERIWYMPEITCFYDGSSSSTTGNGTCTIERDKFANGTGTALINLSYAWYFCYHLVSLDISGLFTPNVTSLYGTFQYCHELEYIDVAHFDTAKVTSICYMFHHCQRVKSLDLRTWNTQKLTGSGLSYAFTYCYALQEIKGLENFYTNNITSLASTFNSCYSLTDLSGITYWNTAKVTNLSSTFYGCYGIKKLNLSHWDIGKVTTVGSLFYNCQNLESILFPQGQTDTLTGSQASIFYCCYNLQEADISWLKPFTSAVTSIGYLFYHCRSLIEINIPEGWDITGCVGSESCYRTFADCYKLQKITGVSNWDMSNYNYTLAYMFENCFCLKEVNIKNWCPHTTSLYYAFYNCRALEEIDLTGWHWENMTGTALSATFCACTSLKSLKGIEHAGDYGNINNISSCFSDCYSLTSIPDISSWNVTKVTNCSSMFSSCCSLQTLTITNWTLTKCTTIANMFRYCYSLKELELTGWSLPALTTNPDYIFCQLHKLEKCSGLPIGLNHRYQEAYSLPEDQWARIFTQLPTVSNKTLNITTANINRLTATTKAIATNKGWTLAN